MPNHDPSERQHRPATPEAIESVEASIRAAAGYVQPSDNLRPRTVEAARSGQTRREQRRGWIASCVLLAALCSLVTAMLSDLPERQRWLAPAVIDDYQLREQHRTTQHRTPPSPWAFADAFGAWREAQLERFQSISKPQR